MKTAHRQICLLALALVCLLLQGCSVGRFVPEDAYLLDGVSIHSDDKEIKTEDLQGYIRQHPNNRWFSLLRVPLRFYCISGTDSTKRRNRFFRRLGEAPVIYNRDVAQRTAENIELAVQNMGFLNAEVELLERTTRRRMNLSYRIKARDRYMVRNLERDVQDTLIRRMLQDGDYQSKLRGGMKFDLNKLEEERSAITGYLQNQGFYRFHKEFIRFEADTAVGGHAVDLRMILLPYRSAYGNPPRPHQRYTIGGVDYNVEQGSNFHIRRKVVNSAIGLREGDLFRERNVTDTYSRFSRFGAILNSNIRFEEHEDDSTALDAHVTLIPNKLNSFDAEVEGTNSAGDFGAALALSYQNRNLFHGSELLSLKVRGAFEAIKGLSGYQDQNYIEYSAEAALTFPDFKFPFLRRAFRRKVQATSEVAFSYDSQDRPEFHRRVVAGVLRYKWGSMNRRWQHRVDLLDLNYVFMPWISSTFRDLYLDDPSNRNAILRYNYENLFIMKLGYSFSYISSRQAGGGAGTYGTNAYAIRGSVESSGNLLYGLSSALGMRQNGQEQYTLFNIAYAQYVKGDIDLSKSFHINETNSVALHLGLGIAYPYGNSTILPYEKRYFSGGANSVRGWSVRELGPGSFVGNDGRIDFINQTGDLKLDMNFEYRTHFFWKLDGAFFVDAGNIWTIREYTEQPGGQFRFDTFLSQIAVAYGLGIRLNFNYFLLRLDGGMKAIHPAYSDGRRHYPVLHPNFGRDFSLHFAVGLPF